MKHLITSVDTDSPAADIGIKAGDSLAQINGNDVVDIIDYEQLTCCEKLVVVFELQNGEVIEADIEKDMYTPLGLNFESSLMSPVRVCKNHCLFCFIDQMNKGGRDTLHFKDDDWRLSLIMGNYVTLTNVDDNEFERIIKRRVSPLYVSVHATDGEIRKQMMRNPNADLIMKRLTRLRDEKLSFHAQVVLCPEINDADVLRKTIEDLYSLYPSAQSVAVVPVGLTKHRDGLFPLRRLTPTECIDTIRMIENMQKQYFKEVGTRFVFAADEMYTYAKLDLPCEESYEDYPQLENGIGLLRKFEYEFLYELEDIGNTIINKLGRKRLVLHGATGKSAYTFMQGLFDKLEPYGIKLMLHPIRNDFFGEAVTVAGLTCACDIIEQLKDENIQNLIVPSNMLRENDDVFLDGKRLDDIRCALDANVFAFSCFDGGAFLHELVDNIDSYK